MALPPITKFEMNRLAHARAQEIPLPGSPAGVSGHAHLSKAALHNFGVQSWSSLNVDQMRKIYEHLDTYKRMPVRGELSK